MRVESSAPYSIPTTVQPDVFPPLFLNCYALTDPSQLEWPVRTYKIVREDGQPQSHTDRGAAKNVIWKLRKKHASRCKGFGFVIDLNEGLVAVPESWDLPPSSQVENHVVTLDEQFTTNASEPRFQHIISGILREAVKTHFKNNSPTGLGELWQDYNQFCQMPNEDESGDYLWCRRIGVATKMLCNKKWGLEFLISTATLDRRTFADYYSSGSVAGLASMVEKKRLNRRTRQNRQVDIRVWRKRSTAHQLDVTVLNLDDPGVILGHATLSSQEQKSLVTETVRCKPFNGRAIEVPLNEVRLVLDSQITQEQHGDTIIEPAERAALMRQMRSCLHGINIFGNKLLLSETPIDTAAFPTISIVPPSVRVKGKNGGIITIETPKLLSEDNLKKRVSNREKSVRFNGFLEQRPINPLLAWPKQRGAVSREQARRMKNDLNHLWRNQGVNYEFEYFLYRNVEHLRKKIEQDDYDALLAVLPEGSRQPQHPNDTHEAIKKKIEVPSQCIHYDHTLPEAWVNKPRREFQQAQPRLYKRIQQRYELCLGNLLVKHNWIPFAPAESSHYNVHIGLDVGGQHNNKAMACFGYGFQRPHEGLLFHPEEIPISVQKAEPIPKDSLFHGLLNLFEYVHAELTSAGLPIDFNHTLFFRDGRLLGDGDQWNEKDALLQLHSELLNRQWITEDSVWTVVEILKNAEGWRLLRSQEKFTNPVVGQCVFPFVEENEGLVCTTGSPYLSQGTACPLKIRILNIHGLAERLKVVQDMVWEADMCFTKMDTAMSLPWVLHVADTGALQKSRSYRITGITV